MELENPSQTTRHSVKMVEVKKKKKCCLHKWTEFESISLCPSKSAGMAAAGTTSVHGSRRDHRFCLRRASE